MTINNEPKDLKEDITTISLLKRKGIRGERVSRNQVLDYIRKNAPITKYKLSKDLNIAYTTIEQIVREFEFAGLVKIKVVMGNNNRCHALICLEEERNEND